MKTTQERSASAVRALVDFAAAIIMLTVAVAGTVAMYATEAAVWTVVGWMGRD